MVKPDIDFVIEVLDFFFRIDANEDLWWNTTGPYAPLTFFLNIHDSFDKGSPDGDIVTPETLLLLKQCAEEIKAVEPESVWMTPLLHGSRQRKLLPKRAGTAYSLALKKLFEESYEPNSHTDSHSEFYRHLNEKNS